jgi:hypothetical protein
MVLTSKHGCLDLHTCLYKILPFLGTFCNLSVKKLFSGLQKSWGYYRIGEVDGNLPGAEAFSGVFLGADAADMRGRVIEAVITSCTRNAVVLYWARGFESHTLRSMLMSTSVRPFVGFFIRCVKKEKKNEYFVILKSISCSKDAC